MIEPSEIEELLQTEEPERLTYSVGEVATILGISRNTAYEGVRTGDIPSISVGKRILVPKAALNRMLALATS